MQRNNSGAKKATEVIHMAIGIHIASDTVAQPQDAITAKVFPKLCACQACASRGRNALQHEVCVLC